MDENIKVICKKYIFYGAAIRFILTLGSFFLISKYLNTSYLFIVLPIILTLLDSVDNIFLDI